MLGPAVFSIGELWVPKTSPVASEHPPTHMPLAPSLLPEGSPKQDSLSFWSQRASCLESSSGTHLERGFCSHACRPADGASAPPKNSLLCLQPGFA